MLQNSVMILSAYMTFVIAQNYLEVSGVIALVGFGLTVSYMGRLRLKPQVNKFMRQFWELAAHIANTLIFIIVGVVIALKVDFSWMDLLILICVYAGINIIRILIITIFYPIMKRSGYGLSVRESTILSWGGLRGALGLTMALMVSYTFSIPEPIRRQVLFLTAGIVTLTLTINATTIGWLLKKLGLAEIPSSKLLLDYSVKSSCTKVLKIPKRFETEGSVGSNRLEYCRTVPTSKEIYPEMPVRTKDVMADIRLRILDRERSLYWSLYTNGVISSGTQRRLNAAIDEQYDRDGKKPLCDRGDILNSVRNLHG